MTSPTSTQTNNSPVSSPSDDLRNPSRASVSQTSKYLPELEKFKNLSDAEKQESIEKFVMSKIHGRMHSRGLRGSIDREDVIDGIYGTVIRGGKFDSDRLDSVMQQAVKLAELADMIDTGASAFPADIIGLSLEELNRRLDQDPVAFWLSAESLVYEQRKNGTYKKYWTDDSFSTYAVDSRTGKRVVPGFDPESDLRMSVGDDIDGTPIDPLVYAGLKTSGKGSNIKYSDHKLKANAKACADLVNAGFEGISNIYGYSYRTIANTNTLSNHARGKAIDFMIAGYRSDNGIANGNNIAAFLIENADALQVRRIIWRGKIWDGNRETWRPYRHPGGRSNDTLDHFDHLHVDFR